MNKLKLKKALKAAGYDGSWGMKFLSEESQVKILNQILDDVKAEFWLYTDGYAINAVAPFDFLPKLHPAVRPRVVFGSFYLSSCEAPRLKEIVDALLKLEERYKQLKEMGDELIKKQT